MIIEHKKILGADGQPEAAVIPWEVFMTLSEPEELDLSAQEERDLREALTDSKAGNREAFVPAEQV